MNVVGGLIVLLLGAGLALALFRPGDLDDEETSAPATTAPTEASTTTSGPPATDATSTTGAPAATSTTATTSTSSDASVAGTTQTTSGAAGGGTSTTEAGAAGGPTTTAAPTTSTTTAGGLGTDGAGQVTQEGEPLANTGGEVLVGPALALIALGMLLGAASRALGRT